MEDFLGLLELDPLEAKFICFFKVLTMGALSFLDAFGSSSFCEATAG